MRKEMIELYVAQLRASFGNARAPVNDDELEKMYVRKDYESMIALVQKIMRLDLRLFMSLVNSGGPANAPAWIDLPIEMPVYGTSAFRQTRATLNLRKGFLAEGSFETAVLAIAHELSHVLLHATYHNLRWEEEAVDLTAMFFGFRDFYITGCRKTVIKPLNQFVAVRKTIRTSYLSYEEVSYAAELMVSNRLR